MRVTTGGFAQTSCAASLEWMALININPVLIRVNIFFSLFVALEVPQWFPGGLHIPLKTFTLKALNRGTWRFQTLPAG
jgi:hypothetical protein